MSTGPSESRERSGADEGLLTHRTLDLHTVEVDELLDRPLLVGLAGRPLDSRLTATLHREGDGADLVAKVRQLAPRLHHHRVGRVPVELRGIEALGLVTHEPILDRGDRVRVGLALLVLLSLAVVDVALLVLLALALCLTLLEPRVQRRLFLLEIALEAQHGRELHLTGLGPGRTDHLERAQVERVRLARLELGTGLENAGLEQKLERLLRDARLDLVHDEVAVTHDVVRAILLHILGTTLAVLRQDLDVLERPEREIEALVVADDVEHLQRAIARALEHARIDHQLPTALVGALGDVDDRLRILDQLTHDVQHRVVGTDGLEARADEALPAREDAAEAVLRLASFAIREGVADLLGQPVFTDHLEVLGGGRAIAREHRLRRVRADEGQLVVVIHRLQRGALLERLAVDAALDHDALGVLAGLDEQHRLALVEGRALELRTDRLAHLRGDADEARDRASARLERDVDRTAHGLLEGLADAVDGAREVLDLADVAIEAVTSALTHQTGEERGVVPVPVPNDGETSAGIGDSLGRLGGLVLLLLDAPLVGNGTAVGEQDAYVGASVGDLLHRLERELERFAEDRRVHDLDALVDRLVQGLTTLLVAACRTRDQLGAVMAAEDDERDKITLDEFRDELLAVVADVADDARHRAGAVDDLDPVMIFDLLDASDVDLEQDAMCIDLGNVTGTSTHDVHVGPLSSIVQEHIFRPSVDRRPSVIRGGY